MKSPTRQQEVQLDEGDFIELEAEVEGPDDAIESECLLKKMLEAVLFIAPIIIEIHGHLFEVFTLV